MVVTRLRRSSLKFVGLWNPHGPPDNPVGPTRFKATLGQPKGLVVSWFGAIKAQLNGSTKLLCLVLFSGLSHFTFKLDYDPLTY